MLDPAACSQNVHRSIQIAVWKQHHLVAAGDKRLLYLIEQMFVCQMRMASAKQKRTVIERSAIASRHTHGRFSRAASNSLSVVLSAPAGPR